MCMVRYFCVYIIMYGSFPSLVFVAIAMYLFCYCHVFVCLILFLSSAVKICTNSCIFVYVSCFYLQNCGYCKYNAINWWCLSLRVSSLVHLLQSKNHRFFRDLSQISYYCLWNPCISSRCRRTHVVLFYFCWRPAALCSSVASLWNIIEMH